MDDDQNPEQRLTRRDSLLKLGGLAATAVGAAAWQLEAPSAADGAALGGPAGVASGLVACVLAPEQTAGPYFLEGDKLRRDVRDGKRGALLTLRTTLVDVSTCKPIRGAAVDIWHCDANGVYAGVAAQNTVGLRFLRGIQRTDASGVAVFKTIYPGYYSGRTVHIHVRVYLGGSVLHTGQLYFPDALTDAVYKRAPYSRRPSRATRNANDSLYRNGGRKSTLAVARSGDGYVGRITMGVSRS
jgi:protocatechuate 3,4-dioxygenase beta subunit